MIGEIDQVQPRFAAAGRPRARGLKAVVPAIAITELPGGGQALDIFDQRAGIVDLRAGVGITEQPANDALNFALINVHPVGVAENGAQHFRVRVGPSGVLLLDGVPGVFIMIHAIIAPVRPINRLMQVPKPRRMDITRGSEQGRRRQSRRRDNDGRANAEQGFQSDESITFPPRQTSHLHAVCGAKTLSIGPSLGVCYCHENKST